MGCGSYKGYGYYKGSIGVYPVGLILDIGLWVIAPNPFLIVPT